MGDSQRFALENTPQIAKIIAIHQNFRRYCRKAILYPICQKVLKIKRKCCQKYLTVLFCIQLMVFPQLGGQMSQFQTKGPPYRH